MSQSNNEMDTLHRNYEAELAACGGRLDVLFAKYDNRLKELVFSDQGMGHPEFKETVEMLDAIQYAIVQDYMKQRGWVSNFEDPPYFRWVHPAEPKPPKNGSILTS